MTEAPEGRHLCSGPEALRIQQPNRQPFLAQLDANVFQVWSDFLLILHLILRLQVHLIDTSGEETIGDAQTLRTRQQSLHFVLVFNRL